jgi:poly [ADP-ribose] polymerase
MAPKRGKKAAAPSKPALEGCTIVLSGTFPGATHGSIKTRVEALGAVLATSVTDKATHLVATENDYKKPSPKVAKAQSLGIKIVSLDWLSACEEGNTKESEDSYVPGVAQDEDESTQPDASKSAPAASSQTNGTTRTSTRTRKRAPSPVVDSVSDTEPAPKAKRTRGRKAAAVKTEEEDDVDMPDANDAADTEIKEEEEKPAKAKVEKAMGEGQVAKSKTMQIPLDEGCPFITSKVYIDDAGVIYDASLNQTNASNNNNKFYRIQVRFANHLF